MQGQTQQFGFLNPQPVQPPLEEELGADLLEDMMVDTAQNNLLRSHTN